MKLFRAVTCLFSIGFFLSACASRNDPGATSGNRKNDEKEVEAKILSTRPRLTLNCEFPRGANSVAIARDGKTLIAYGDGKDEVGILQIWNLMGPKKTHQLEFRGTLASGGSLVAFTRDGKNAIVAGSKIRICDLESGKELSALDSSPLTGQLRVCPNRDIVAAVNIHGIDLHDLKTRSRRNLWYTKDVARALSEFFDNGERIAWAINKGVKDPMGGFLTEGFVTLWNIPDGKAIRTIFQNKTGIDSIAVSADGKLLGVAEAERGIKVLEVEGGTIVREITTHLRSIRTSCMVFLPDNKTLVYEGSSQNGKARLALTDVKQRTTRLIVTDHQTTNAAGLPMEVSGLCLSPDNATLATVSNDNTICLWDLKQLTLK